LIFRKSRLIKTEDNSPVNIVLILIEAVRVFVWTAPTQMELRALILIRLKRYPTNIPVTEPASAIVPDSRKSICSIFLFAKPRAYIVFI